MVATSAGRARIIRTCAMTAGGFHCGQRVELPPHMDAWMRGDRYGEIVGFGRIEYEATDDAPARELQIARVKMDKSGRTLNAPLDGLRFV